MDACRCLACETNRIIELRKGLQMARLIEIAGLGDAVKSMRKDIAGLKSVAKDINTEAPLLLAEMTDIRDQIREHRADLKADAASLGNSGAQSNGSQGDEKQPVVSLTAQEAATLAEQVQNAQATPASPPAVGQTATFQPGTPGTPGTVREVRGD